MLAAAGVALIYFEVFRRWLKAKLTVRDQASNGDAVLGKTGVVIRRPEGSLDAYIWVNDLDPLHAKLKQRGAKIVEAPAMGVYKCYEMIVEDELGFRLAFGMDVSSQPDGRARS